MVCSCSRQAAYCSSAPGAAGRAAVVSGAGAGAKPRPLLVVAGRACCRRRAWPSGQGARGGGWRRRGEPRAAAVAATAGVKLWAALVQAINACCPGLGFETSQLTRVAAAGHCQQQAELQPAGPHADEPPAAAEDRLQREGRPHRYRRSRTVALGQTPDVPLELCPLASPSTQAATCWAVPMDALTAKQRARAAFIERLLSFNERQLPRRAAFRERHGGGEKTKSATVHSPSPQSVF